jgi:hypothetical protein
MRAIRRRKGYRVCEVFERSAIAYILMDHATIRFLILSPIRAIAFPQ